MNEEIITPHQTIASIEAFYKHQTKPLLKKKPDTSIHSLPGMTYLGSTTKGDLMRIDFPTHTSVYLQMSREYTAVINFFEGKTQTGSDCFGFEFEEVPTSGGMLRVGKLFSDL